MKNYKIVYYFRDSRATITTKITGNECYERDEAFDAIYGVIHEKIKQLKPGETIVISKGNERMLTNTFFKNGTTECEDMEVHYAE